MAEEKVNKKTARNDKKAEKKRLKEEKKLRKEELRAEKTANRKPSNNIIVKAWRLFEDALYELIEECDFRILITTLILTVFGVVMVFSAGYYTTTTQVSSSPYYYLIRQGIFAVSGSFILLVFSKIDYHFYMKVWKPIIVVCILLLVALIPFGTTINGATRWLYIGSFGITPSEIAKLGVIIFMACFLAEDPSRGNDFKRGILPSMVLMVLLAGLIIWQPNLSTAVVVCAIIVGMLFVAGMSWGYIGGVGAVGVAGIMYILLYKQDSHWYTRLTTFLDPFVDEQGDSYQVVQSLIALGNGGLTGQGLGNSVAKYLYLPEPMNDFILAVIGEECGFIGVILLMCAFAYLFYRCFLVASKACDNLGLYLAAGITIMLALHVVLNIAVVTSSMPATGITLPFISYGGTSLWTFMASIGIVLNVSKQNNAKERVLV